MSFIFANPHAGDLSPHTAKGAAIRCITPRIYNTKAGMIACGCEKCIGQVCYAEDQGSEVAFIEFVFWGITEGVPKFVQREVAVLEGLVAGLAGPSVSVNPYIDQLAKDTVKGSALHSLAPRMYATEIELVNDFPRFGFGEVAYAMDMHDAGGVWEYRFGGTFWMKDYLPFVV